MSNEFINFSESIRIIATFFLQLFLEIMKDEHIIMNFVHMGDYPEP